MKERKAKMHDLMNKPLFVGDEVVYANGGRLYRGTLFSISGPTCNSCVVAVPELNGRLVTLKLRKSRIPFNVLRSQLKDVESGRLVIISQRLMKV